MSTATPPAASNTIVRRRRDGRDELNLADFPISVLRWQQPRRDDGRKVDEIEYVIHAPHAPPRKVVLSAPSRVGLPTPIDEMILLSILCVAKQSDFAEPVVHFHPYQLFQILDWFSGGRSYLRLREAIERLQKLSITYERTWYDRTKKELLEQFHTGIIAEGYVVTPRRGRRKVNEIPGSWIRFTDSFYASLKAGNLKRLNLEVLFSLKLPLSQRLYRHLDKHLYRSDTYERDLKELACGHLGMKKTDNVAEIKRRLAAAIVELEQIQFIEPAPKEKRFRRLQSGIWRVRFEKLRSNEPMVSRQFSAYDSTDPAVEIVREFLGRQRSDRKDPNASELEFARQCIETHGVEELRAAIPKLVSILRKEWPNARTFLAAKEYLPQALKLVRRSRHIDDDPPSEHLAAATVGYEELLDRWGSKWESLEIAEKNEIQQSIRSGWPHLFREPLCRKEIIQRQIHRLFLQELAIRQTVGNED